MKIVNRETFLSLPAGTVFSKYEPCVFGDLAIKGATLPADDFLYQSIVDAIQYNGLTSDFTALLHKAAHDGSSLPMAFEWNTRDGCFDADQLFAVWSAVDVMKLVKRLLQACGDMFSGAHHG